MFSLFLGSCLTVSREQGRMVRQFAKSTENFSVFPLKIGSELACIREGRGIYYANSLTEPLLHLAELDAIFKERMNDDRLPGRVGVAFKVLDRYADGLLQLTSDAPFTARSRCMVRFGSEMDTLVGKYNQVSEGHHLPAGIGTAFAAIVAEGTNHFLAGRQYQLLRRYVIGADTLVSSVCAEMLSWLSSETLRQLIQNEETGIHESFRFFFTKRSQPTIECDRDYLDLMKRVENLNSLRLQTMSAVRDLAVVHRKLAEALSGKRTLQETIEQLTTFYSEMEHLRNLFDTLKHPKYN